MTYLIFGGTGSLGKKLIDRFSTRDNVVVYSRDEAKHWSLRNELTLNGKKNVKFIVGDIRDRDRVLDAIRQVKPSVIIVAAALKQVDTCEISPNESILTNITGTQNVLWAVDSIAMPLKVLFVSTDKACAPVNVYGMCKSISERLITSHENPNNVGQKFLCTRYGNVLESRGSIIPLFKYQALNGNALTVTDPNMTRFLMTLDDSVDLIETTLKYGKSGETWIPKLPSMRIGDLANIFVEESGKPIKIIGLRPGEKKHEDLINESESVRTSLTLDKKHYVIGPVMGPYQGDRFTYSSSDDVMSKNDLKNHLKKLGIIDAPLESFAGCSIEEIRTT